jgi:hypothetical protein
MAKSVQDTKPIKGRKWTVQGGNIERIVALLLSWRVLTSQQISAMASIDRPNASRTLKDMMWAGLLERSKMIAQYSASASMPFLWRLRLESAEYQKWFRSLTKEQQWALTLGVEGGSGGHDRHDILMAETVLRAAEVMPKLQAVFGERAAMAKVLFADHPSGRTRGDAMLVRDDGLRIVLEFTTQPTIAEVRQKMAQWARLLGERNSPSGTGVVVVFVSGQYSGGGRELLQKSYIRAIIPEIVGADNPATPSVMASARLSIFLADWHEWFPAPWCISKGFAELEAYYSPAPGRFAPVKLMSPSKNAGVPFTPTLSANWQQPRQDRRLFPAIPRWIEGPVQWIAEGNTEL